MPTPTLQRFTTCLILLALTACGNPAHAVLPTALPADVPASLPTQESTPSPAPTITPTPLAQQVHIGDTTTNESGKAPDYTFKTDIPVLQGSSDPRVKNFNDELMAQVVQPAIAQFRKELTTQPAKPLAGGSYFDVRYELISPPGNNIISLQIKIEGMSDGAAHPYHVILPFNYDLEKGEKINLSQLFLQDVNALQIIADQCKAELAKRDIGSQGFESGSDPTVENYAVWNLSSAGLVIVFNEYQVAPYFAGPQSVTIPLDKLSSIIDPSGALTGWRP